MPSVHTVGRGVGKLVGTRMLTGAGVGAIVGGTVERMGAAARTPVPRSIAAMLIMSLLSSPLSRVLPCPSFPWSPPPQH